MVSLPEAFADYTRRLMGDDRYARFLAAFDGEPPVSIRLNPLRVESLESPVVSPHLSLREVSGVGWCPLGFYLDRRPNFTFDPLLHAGCYYVQEAASMFVHHVLGQYVDRPVQVLDLCAAPGGKATCALGALPPGTELWANEPVRQRASILSENIQKWGCPRSIVTNNYPCDYVRSGLTFDVVLCDVPCSGEGMFRRDVQTISEWSLQNVEKCSRLQREIVADAWQCLRTGGLLVYSTCTFNTKENEENVCWMLEHFDAELLSVSTQPDWGITGSLLPGFKGPVYRFIPGITRSEGLFVAVLRKREGVSGTLPCKGKAKHGLDNPPSVLKVVSSSADEKPLTAGMAELDYPTAIAYLRGEAVVLPADTPRGLVTVTFRGHPLGLVKNIGTRANNLYPKEWRIRSTHVPEDYVDVVDLRE